MSGCKATTTEATAAEGTAPATESAENGSWLDGLSDEHKALAAARSWDTPGKAIESYRNLEKLRGVPADRIVTLPGEDADDDAWRSVYQKLGAPENADGYKLELPEDATVSFDDARVGQFKELAHKLGLTPQQANELAKWEAQSMSSAMQQSQEVSEETAKAQDMELRKEWGAAYDRQVSAAKNAVREFGFTPEMIDAMEQSSSYADVMKAFAKIGSAVGKEDSFESGGGSSASFQPITPQAAQQKINDLMLDPEFKKQYMSGNKAAVQRMDSLQSMAHTRG